MQPSQSAIHEAAQVCLLVHHGCPTVSASLEPGGDERGSWKARTLHIQEEVDRLTPVERTAVAFAGSIVAAMWIGVPFDNCLDAVSKGDRQLLKGVSPDDTETGIAAIQLVLDYLADGGVIAVMQTAAVLESQRYIATDAWVRWESARAPSMSVH
jgi:hypothetical protein